MARGDKNYDKVVRGVKNASSDKKKKAIHKMVESLIKGDSDAAAEQLHAYLQLKTRELFLGEKEECEEEDMDEKKEKDDEDEKEEKSEKKEKVDESAHNFLHNKPHKANDTKAKPAKKLPNQKGKVAGNVYTTKPHKANDTKAKPAKKLPNQKGKVTK